MSCDELRDEYELYALGLAAEDAPDEAAELRAHLHRGCQDCTAGVRSARGLLALLGATVPAVAPSPALRRRIMTSVGASSPASQRAWGWTPLWIALTAFSLVIAFYFYGRDHDNALQAAKFQAQAREQAIELVHWNEALAVLNQPDTVKVAFGEATPKPRGSVFVNPKSGVLLLASNLPPAPAGKAYEMWVIPKTGIPAAAGLFQSSAQGTALYLRQAPVNIAATRAVAVTLEPAGGVPQPTSEPVIVAGLTN